MDRAAERAAREAQGPLVAAVTGLQIADARAILRTDGAATQYLRRASGDALRERFAPVVASAMRGTGVHRAYEELRSRNRVLALLEDPTVDLERYVTDETLDGLFTLIREEEQRIRNDPSARTTELLRVVFGQPNSMVILEREFLGADPDTVRPKRTGGDRHGDDSGIQRVRDARQRRRHGGRRRDRRRVRQDRHVLHQRPADAAARDVTGGWISRSSP